MVPRAADDDDSRAAADRSAERPTPGDRHADAGLGGRPLQAPPSDDAGAFASAAGDSVSAEDESTVPGHQDGAGDRSVTIDRDAINTVIVTGDHNQVVERLVQIGAPTGLRELEIRIGAESPNGTFPVSTWV